MKKKIIGIATLLLLLTAICLTVHFTVNPTFVRNGNENAAARKIAESWLRKQISLRNYEVTEAHFYQMRSGERYVSMTYSVQPYKTALKDWYAGNGENGEDGWLINKYGMITYRFIGPFVVTGTACNTGP